MEPYLHGRHNIIEKNDIYRVMERLGDGNGIYISGCGKGNVARLNYIHDIFGPGSNSMIRIDDLQNETLIEKNLICRCGGSGVYLKHKNDFVNNLLVDLDIEDPEGLYPGKPAFSGYIGLRRAPIHGSKIQRKIYYSTGGDVEILSEGTHRPTWGSSYLRECDADNNLYFSPANADWASKLLEEKQAEGVEQNSVQADPRITDCVGYMVILGKEPCRRATNTAGAPRTNCRNCSTTGTGSSGARCRRTTVALYESFLDREKGV